MKYFVTFAYAGIPNRDDPEAGPVAGVQTEEITRSRAIAGIDDIRAMEREFEFRNSIPRGAVCIINWRHFEDIENCPTCNSENVTVKPGYVNRCYDCNTTWKV